jgi:SAM-dependent methyltransferase
MYFWQLLVEAPWDIRYRGEHPMSNQQLRSDDSSVPSIAWDWVARLYDTYVPVTYDIPFYLRAAARASDILELMCGTGRISLPLAEAGANLTCVDVSSAMLAVLNEKLDRRPELRGKVYVVRMDVRQLALHRQFDLVLLPFQSFGEITSPDDQHQALTRIHQHMKDGGRFICTLHNPQLRRQTLDGQLRLLGKFPLAKKKGALLLWGLATYDPATQLVEGVQLYEEYDGVGLLQRTRLLEIRFVLLERDQFEARAAAAGLRMAALYGDYDAAPFDEQTSPFLIWVLEKA